MWELLALQILVGWGVAWGTACWSPSPHKGLGSWGTPPYPLLTPPFASALGELVLKTAVVWALALLTT